MKTIEQIQSEVKKLYNELEVLRQAQEPQQIDLDKIIRLSMHNTIPDHPMQQSDTWQKECYLKLLFSVAVLEKQHYEETLKTAVRIACSIGINEDVERLLIEARKINAEVLDEFAKQFRDSSIKYLFLLECMLISAPFGNKKALTYIAELATWLKIEKQEMVFLAHTARVIITQDLKEYKINTPNHYSALNCYLEPFRKEFDIRKIYVPCVYDSALGSIRGSYNKIYSAFFNFGLTPTDCTLSKVTFEEETNTFQCKYKSNSLKSIPIDDDDIVDDMIVKINLNAIPVERIVKAYALVAVTSKHPLAHSMAIQDFQNEQPFIIK